MATEVFSVRLTCTTGNSNKFYEITVEQRDLGLAAMVAYGPIGRTQSRSLFAAWGYQDAGQAQHPCRSARAFVLKVNTQINSKLKKGYRVESAEAAMGWTPEDGHLLNTAAACSLDGSTPVAKPKKSVARRARSLDAWLSKEDGAASAILL